MTLGTWNPETGLEKLAYRVDTEVLTRCATFAGLEQWHTLADWEKDNLPASAPQMMKLSADDWAPVLQQLDSATLVKLVRFFTVAEHTTNLTVQQVSADPKAGNISITVLIMRSLICSILCV